MKTDASYDRISQVDALVGKASKAERELGRKVQAVWRIRAEMRVDADRESLENQ